MEFKEKLKQLRIQKGLTQAQLAEKLFVSRSTVAKWENGLGLPNSESMATLENLFDVYAEDLATEEPENVIVKKNRSLKRIGEIVVWSTIYSLIFFKNVFSFIEAASLPVNMISITVFKASSFFNS